MASLVDERMGALASVVPQIDPTLEGTVRTTLGKMQHEMQTLHNKVIQAAKRKDETLRRQFQRAQALTFPAGHPQEREVGFVWFLNRYGSALIPRLLEEANYVAQSYIPEVKRVTRGAPAPNHKPSILQDYELGRPMEIDALVRAPAAFARAADLSTPMLDLIAALAIQRARDKGLYQA